MIIYQYEGKNEEGLTVSNFEASKRTAELVVAGLYNPKITTIEIKKPSELVALLRKVSK